MTYSEFIQNIIDTRGQWSVPECGIWENHHIIPRCIGGLPIHWRHDTVHENMIWLSPHEHYEAHKLLAEENSHNKKVCCAYWRLAQTYAGEFITAEEYEESRLFFIKNVASKPMSEEVKQKLRRPKSDECRKHMSEAQRGLKKGPAWNKGLTKDTDNRVKFNAEQTSNGMKENHLIPWNKGLDKSDPRVARNGYLSGLRNKGKHLSEERKLKISKSSSKPVRCIETGEIFNSVIEAVKLTGVKTNIGNVCNGKRKTAGGFHWEWYNKEKDD